MNSWDGQPRIASNINPITVALAVALIALTTTASLLLACSSPSTPAAPTDIPDQLGMPQADSAPDVATSVPNPTVPPFVPPTQSSRPETTPSPIPTTTPTPMPTATASPTPTATATQTPTATPTATPTPTPVPPIYVATGLTAESVSATDGEIQMQMTLAVENIGGPIAEETLEVTVVYTADGVEEPLTLNILAADEIAHEFSVSVPPGVIRFNVEIHGEAFPFDRVAEAADLEIIDTEWEAVSDGRIVVNATVQNAGNADAEDVIVIGVAEDDDGAVTEGKGQTELIPVGESRTVEVFLNLPADEHDIRLRVTTASLEADVHDNEGLIEAEVTYVEIAYDYIFTPGSYWSDGSANVDVAVSAYNRGVGAFSDTAEMSYSCAGAGSGDDVATGKFEFKMSDGFSAVTEEITLRSSPGNLECRFISQEQGTETHEFDVPAKVVGVSREVWECYRDSTINRQDDIGCAGRYDESVVKWDLDRPLKVWATGDPDYVDVLWATLDELSPILDMTFTRVLSQDEADLKVWVGITLDEGPEDLRSGECVDAAGCAFTSWSSDYVIDGASIGVWTVGSDWFHSVGLVDRRIENVTLHELLHALMPMGHRDDPLSAVNNINAPDWINLDPLEEALIRLHRNRLIRPGMTMEQVRELVVLEEEMMDAPSVRDESPTPIKMLREAYRTLQNADSATWRIEGGWRGNGCDFQFEQAEYTIASFHGDVPRIARFFGGSDELFVFDDETYETWNRDAGDWLKDDSEFWQRTNWDDSTGGIHTLLVSALYFGTEGGIRVSTASPGTTRLGFDLDRTIVKYSWFRSAELDGWVDIDTDTLEIKGYQMDWQFEVNDEDSCDLYRVTAIDGEYGVPFDVPNDVYEGTTENNRQLIDRYRNP